MFSSPTGWRSRSGSSRRRLRSSASRSWSSWPAWSATWCWPAAQTYYEPIRPLMAPVESERALDDLLDIEDVLGKRIVETPLQRSVTIREENARAALEVMSRFAADPRWLIYLPPTMSPPATS